MLQAAPFGKVVLDLPRTQPNNFTALCMGQIFPDYVFCKNCSKFSLSFFTVVEISKQTDFHVIPNLHRTRHSYNGRTPIAMNWSITL